MYEPLTCQWRSQVVIACYHPHGASDERTKISVRRRAASRPSWSIQVCKRCQLTFLTGSQVCSPSSLKSQHTGVPSSCSAHTCWALVLIEANLPSGVSEPCSLDVPRSPAERSAIQEQAARAVPFGGYGTEPVGRGRCSLCCGDERKGSRQHAIPADGFDRCSRLQAGEPGPSAADPVRQDTPYPPTRYPLASIATSGTPGAIVPEQVEGRIVEGRQLKAHKGPAFQREPERARIAFRSRIKPTLSEPLSRMPCVPGEVAERCNVTLLDEVRTSAAPRRGT